MKGIINDPKKSSRILGMAMDLFANAGITSHSGYTVMTEKSCIAESDSRQSCKPKTYLGTCSWHICLEMYIEHCNLVNGFQLGYLVVL